MHFRNSIPALIALLVPFAAEAAAPALIPVTGYLTDDAGVPLDGNVDVQFKIYRGPTGTQSEWNNGNQPMSVDVSEGQFTAYLGSDAVLDLAMFRDNQTLYLGIAVDGGAEMQPRLEIGAAPYAAYAQYCETAATLEGLTSDEFRLSADDILWSEIDPTSLPSGLSNGDDVGPSYVAGTAITITPSGSNFAINANQTAIEGWAQGVAYDNPTELTTALDSIYQRIQTCSANQVLMYNGTAWACTNTSSFTPSESVIDGFVSNNGYAAASDVTALTTRVGTAETDINAAEADITAIEAQLAAMGSTPGNMVAQYELDETAGATSFVDTSGLGNNLAGTLGAVIAGSSTAHSTRSVSFSGGEGLAAASGNDIPDPANVSVELWMRTGDINQTATLLDKTGSYRLRMTGQRAVWSVTTVGGSCTITHNVPLVANAWTHVSASYDGLYVNVAINGYAVAQSCNTGRIAATPGGVFTIGGQRAGTWSEVFTGNIDEVRVRPTASSGPAGGVTYTRWGRTTCPTNSNMVYTGWAGGGHYTHNGPSSQFCMWGNTPEYGATNTYNDGNQNGALIYHMEYETSGYGIASLAALHDFDVPCSVCDVNANAELMIPGRRTCPAGWNMQYRGFLMSEHYTHTRSSDSICIDENAEGIGSSGSQNGALLYPTEVENAGTGSQTGYVHDREVTCVVCTR